MVRYTILGAVELRDDGRRIGVGGPRQVALLALLIVNANRAVSADRLMEALWGDLAGAGALKRLRVAITRLRHTLDPEGGPGASVLRTVAGGYLLAVEPGELDADVFLARVQEGRRAVQAGDARRGLQALDEALGLWRGPALADVAYEQFAQPEIRRLEELRLAALEARVDCQLHLGEHAGVVGELEGLVAAHPGRERLAGQLMVALYRCGRQAEALEVYVRTRTYLAGELGLEPGPALQALQADVLAQSSALQSTFGEPESATDTIAGGCRVAARPLALALPRSLHTSASSPFVGREAELACLCEHWKGILAGERSTVAIGGEVGVGKTRLASELAKTVHREGGLVLYGRCDEGLAAPYQPFVEALRPYARAVGRDRLRAELGDLAPNLGRLLPELGDLGQPAGGDPEAARFALFEAVAALIEAMTREQKALFVLDDLHWAATPTLLALRHLIRSERQLGVLLVIAYRDTELDHSQPLAQLLADLHRDTSTEHVRIRGLDTPAIAALLAATVEPAATSEELVRALGEQTAGNPFFLRELLAVLRESGTTSSEGERPRPGDVAAQLAVPEALRHVIGHRVARLSAPAGRALKVAAVAGARFSFVLLERVVREDMDILDALDEAVAAGLLIEAGQGEYAFAHALVRQTIYGQLSSARRMRLHRQLGEALEALGNAEVHVDALAYHFAQAALDGQGLKAADYALAAGRTAIARLGYEEAAAYYERGLRALTVTGQRHEQRRCELLLAVGEARWYAGELDTARQAYEQAAQIAEELGDATALAHAALGFCGTYPFEARAALTRPVARLLERALAAVGEDDGALRARLMGRLADVRHEAGLATQALQIARRVGDTATLADVLANALWATSGPDAVHEPRAMAEELARAADEINNRRLRVLPHIWLLNHLLEHGDIDAVERELEALLRLAQTRPERYFTWISLLLQANHAFLQGRLEDCETLAEDAFAHRFKARDQPAIRAFRVQMLFVRREQGRLGDLVEATEDFVARFVAQTPDQTAWRCALTWIYAHVERTPQARDALEGLTRDGFEDLPRDSIWLFNLSMLSEVVVLLDDAQRARQLYDLLLPYADRCAVIAGLLCQGSISRPLGLLATSLSRYEEAAGHFEQALTMNAQIRSPLWIAHSRYDYGRMLLLHNHPGDRDKAHQLLTQALTAAQQLGLNALIDKARTLEVTAQTAGPAPDDG